MLNPYSCRVKRRGPLKKRLLWQYSYPLDSNGFKSNGGIISGLQSLDPKLYFRAGIKRWCSAEYEPETLSRATNSVPLFKVVSNGLKSLVGGKQRITGGLGKVGKKNPRPG